MARALPATPPVEVEDEHIGQAHVNHSGHRHPYGGQDGAVVHLYHDFQAVGEDEADGEDRDNPQIGPRSPGSGALPPGRGQLFREEGRTPAVMAAERE